MNAEEEAKKKQASLAEQDDNPVSGHDAREMS